MSTSPSPGTTPVPSPPSNSASPPPAATAPPPATTPPATPSAPSPTTPASPSPPASTSPAPTTTPSPPVPSTPSASPSSSPPSNPTPSTPSSQSGKSPPPPPTRTGTTPSPPPPSSSGSPSTPSSGSSSSSSNVSTELVVGIAVGGVVILLVLSLLFICCKKKRRRRDEEDYYVPPPPSGPKSDVYGGQQYNWQQNPSSRADNVITYPKPSPQPVPSRQPPSSGYSSTTSNTAPRPPPPQPFMSSSGGSGFNYSGGEILRPPSPGIALGLSKSTFTYEELARATEGFSEANLLGQGGFGYVHKGILPNGKEVAVKHLKAGSGQGDREFHAEVEIISRVHHKHLVSLVGYCITGAQRMLVYEFVPNNTLEFHLHGEGRPTMDWPTRMKIALGSAKGLAYLHEDCHPKIIHRDIKAANILLDFKFEAKVADFGLAKFSSDVNTHVSTRVMGTFGYLAPEYASSGKLTDKSDVFSFGVMLLELITGRRPVDSSFMDDSLVDWARPLLTRALDNKNFDSLVDPRLQNEYNDSEMAPMVACAAACVRHSARRRPRMSQIVRALEGDVSLTDLNEGIRPGHSSIHSYGSSDYDTSQYNEDMKNFRKMALGSTEYGGSSEYSNPTSEYGLYPSGSSSEGQTTREMEMGKIKKNNQGFSGNSNL